MDLIFGTLKHFVSSLRWQDALDIALVSFILYRLFLLIRGTRAVQLLRGLLLLLLAYLIANALQLHTITWLVQSTATMIIVAIPIVFQPELRRALALLGQGELFRSESFVAGKGVADPTHLIDELVAAVKYLSSRRTGALIIIERQTGLNEFIETGTPIHGLVSAELLTSLFQTASPLHDGALIIRGDRIAAAGTLLPLSETIRRSARRPIGTRHRAALGLTETTDAVAIVVSEETGAISVAQEGKLQRFMGEEDLRTRLEMLFLVPRPATQLNLGLAFFQRK
ncbi:MAG: TIGR00159 family protein [Cyanobacteria bacterium NC_groundwater_1444_Ag_S-0.65um_54_12]|nr:TIGR00159 family protein [Cyanobacteria bacterium NC_groundwater_1444_Ag_S-0.65um_54_12]